MSPPAGAGKSFPSWGKGSRSSASGSLRAGVAGEDAGLAANVTRQLLARRRAGQSGGGRGHAPGGGPGSGGDDRRRTAGTTSGTPQDEDLPETGYHGWLHDLLESERQLQEDEAAEADRLV
jgi:hypothetical protein